MLLLTIGLPFLLIFKPNAKDFIKKLTKVLSGKMSFVGLHKVCEATEQPIGKIGVIGPSATENQQNISSEAIIKLNNYYIRHY